LDCPRALTPEHGLHHRPGSAGFAKRAALSHSNRRYFFENLQCQLLDGVERRAFTAQSPRRESGEPKRNLGRLLDE